MKKDEIQKLIQNKAVEFNFESKILEAIVQIESGYKTSVARLEKNWPYTDNPEKYAKLNGITAPTETILQQISWGLGQIMGGTVRGLGYDGPLTELINPETNVNWVAVYFKTRCDKYDALTDKIAAYNAGTPRSRNGVYSNQSYVDKVLQVYEELKKA